MYVYVHVYVHVYISATALPRWASHAGKGSLLFILSRSSS